MPGVGELHGQRGELVWYGDPQHGVRDDAEQAQHRGLGQLLALRQRKYTTGVGSSIFVYSRLPF